MGKTYKIIVCGKKSVGKTRLLEQLIYNRATDKYYPTIEDIYVAYWERERGMKEKFRFYDTRGMENSKDTETLNSMKQLFQLVDGAILVYSSGDTDSYQCIEKLKQEIEKSKDKKELCHFIAVDYDVGNSQSFGSSNATIEHQNLLKASVYEIGVDKREQLCKAFTDLASNITQIVTKSSMTLVQSIKKQKVFSSSKWILKWTCLFDIRILN